MREFYMKQARRESIKRTVGAAISMLAGALVLTMPAWMILLGLI